MHQTIYLTSSYRKLLVELSSKLLNKPGILGWIDDASRGMVIMVPSMDVSIPYSPHTIQMNGNRVVEGSVANGNGHFRG